MLIAVRARRCPLRAAQANAGYGAVAHLLTAMPTDPAEGQNAWQHYRDGAAVAAFTEQLLPYLRDPVTMDALIAADVPHDELWKHVPDEFVRKMMNEQGATVAEVNDILAWLLGRIVQPDLLVSVTQVELPPDGDYGEDWRNDPQALERVVAFVHTEQHAAAVALQTHAVHVPAKDVYALGLFQLPASAGAANDAMEEEAPAEFKRSGVSQMASFTAAAVAELAVAASTSENKAHAVIRAYPRLSARTATSKPRSVEALLKHEDEKVRVGARHLQEIFNQWSRACTAWSAIVQAQVAPKGDRIAAYMRQCAELSPLMRGAPLPARVSATRGARNALPVLTGSLHADRTIATPNARMHLGINSKDAVFVGIFRDADTGDFCQLHIHMREGPFEALVMSSFVAGADPIFLAFAPGASQGLGLGQGRVVKLGGAVVHTMHGCAPSPVARIAGEQVRTHHVKVDCGMGRPAEWPARMAGGGAAAGPTGLPFVQLVVGDSQCLPADAPFPAAATFVVDAQASALFEYTRHAAMAPGLARAMGAEIGDGVTLAEPDPAALQAMRDGLINRL